MKILIAGLLLLLGCAGCVVIEYGDFRYTRILEDQTLTGLTITTPAGLTVRLENQENTGKTAEAVQSAIDVLNAIPK